MTGLALICLQAMLCIIWASVWDFKLQLSSWTQGSMGTLGKQQATVFSGFIYSVSDHGCFGFFKVHFPRSRAH